VLDIREVLRRLQRGQGIRAIARDLGQKPDPTLGELRQPDRPLPRLVDPGAGGGIARARNRALSRSITRVASSTRLRYARVSSWNAARSRLP